jgi:hypothetical protein
MPATPTPITTVARPMGTGISRLAAGLVALTLGLAGCGGSSSGGTRASGAFSWLHPQAPPAGWRVVTIPTGATLSYPPGWRRQHSDPGTATAVLRTPGGTYRGYVNLTPRQGAETLANWASFRIEHDAEEGDRHVRRLATAGGLHFLDGHGSCVKDTYTTQTGAPYIELACLVAGHRTESVIVAAAPPSEWANESGTLQRVIGDGGFEPPLPGPEPGVLPLHQSPLMMLRDTQPGRV